MDATEAELPYKIRLLNKLQIVKRQRSLNAEERKLLYNLIIDPTSSNDILTAAYLLLGEQSLAKDHFENFDNFRQPYNMLGTSHKRTAPLIKQY